jgi:hypothetical protein
MVKAHQTAVMRLSAAQLELQSAKAAAATALKQHMTRLQDKLQDRSGALHTQLLPEYLAASLCLRSGSVVVDMHATYLYRACT